MDIYRGRDAIRHLSGETVRGEATVVCPNCRFEYTHVERVGTLVGSDPHESIAAYEGTFPVGATRARRSAVEIVFRCEGCPELFSLVIQQHKGNNFLEVHRNVTAGGG